MNVKYMIAALSLVAASVSVAACDSGVTDQRAAAIDQMTPEQLDELAANDDDQLEADAEEHAIDEDASTPANQGVDDISIDGADPLAAEEGSVSVEYCRNKKACDKLSASCERDDYSDYFPKPGTNGSQGVCVTTHC